MFKVGQRVWEFSRGWGTVDKILDGSPYPIHIIFETGEEESYTFDGKEYESASRTVFFREFSAPEDALVPPVEHISLKYGDVILTTDRTILFVCQDSSSHKDLVRILPRIPRNLDDEYDIMSYSKAHIKKVVGNINDAEDLN